MRKGLFCCLAVLLWIGMLMLMSCGSNSPSSNQVSSAEAVATAALTIRACNKTSLRFVAITCLFCWFAGLRSGLVIRPE